MYIKKKNFSSRDFMFSNWIFRKLCVSNFTCITRRGYRQLRCQNGNNMLSVNFSMKF